MKNFNIYGGSLKNQVFRRIHKTIIYRGELPKKGGLARLQIEREETVQNRGGGVFEGELIPLCTLRIPSCTTLAIKNSFSSENQEYTSYRE